MMDYEFYTFAAAFTSIQVALFFLRPFVLAKNAEKEENEGTAAAVELANAWSKAGLLELKETISSGSSQLSQVLKTLDSKGVEFLAKEIYRYQCELGSLSPAREVSLKSMSQSSTFVEKKSYSKRTKIYLDPTLALLPFAQIAKTQFYVECQKFLHAMVR